MKNKRGISLIVLVITIIVMLVLASAIIITLSNSNIITKAKEAVNKTNDKVLAEQADLYAADLILEFREMGYNNLIVPDIAKEAYKNAIKAGKTEEEAKMLANDSFIGSYEDWQCDGTEVHYFLNGGNGIYDPIYQEVLRVTDLLWNLLQTDNLEIGKLAKLPEDLERCLYNEQAAIKAYVDAGETAEALAIYEQAYDNNEPLKGLMENDENNKYYYLKQTVPVRIPRYVYNFNKTKIYDITKIDFVNIKDNYVEWSNVDKLILDENYTVLSAGIIPGVSGDCEIILPDTLKIIKAKAFRNSDVTKIIIPKSVENIEDGAFNLLVAPSKGTYSGGNATYLQELIIKKEKGSIPGEPWKLDTTRTTITWEP